MPDKIARRKRFIVNAAYTTILTLIIVCFIVVKASFAVLDCAFTCSTYAAFDSFFKWKNTYKKKIFINTCLPAFYLIIGSAVVWVVILASLKKVFLLQAAFLQEYPQVFWRF